MAKKKQVIDTPIHSFRFHAMPENACPIMCRLFHQ